VVPVVWEMVETAVTEVVAGVVTVIFRVVEEDSPGRATEIVVVPEIVVVDDSVTPVKVDVKVEGPVEVLAEVEESEKVWFGLSGFASAIAREAQRRTRRPRNCIIESIFLDSSNSSNCLLDDYCVQMQKMCRYMQDGLKRERLSVRQRNLSMDI